MRIIVRIAKSPGKKATPKRNRSERLSGVNDRSRGNPTPRWFLGLFFSVYILAIVWSTLAYSAEAGVTATPSLPAGRFDVPAYIHSAAKDAGVDPRVAAWIVTHESRFHVRALGDGGASRGIWQINKVWHPEVSDKCAYDVKCSTDWALHRIADGNVDEWSTWKYCRERFDDCPF